MSGHTPWREIKHKSLRRRGLRGWWRRRKTRKALKELTRLSETFPGGYR